MTSKSNQTIFNLNIIDTINSSIERENLEMFIERNNNLQKTLHIENNSQFLIKFKQERNSTIMSMNAVAMNIKSRKNAYAIVLISVFELDLFYATYAIKVKRLNQRKLKISKLYKNDLSIKSRY